MHETPANKARYQESLKASGISGLAQAIQIILKMANTKLVAILLGPAGVGTIGLFQSGINLVSTISSLGIGNSAVRDIAKANKEENPQEISLTIFTLRRLVWISGLIGALFCLIAGSWLSQLSFNSEEYAWSFRILGLMVLLNQISAGQMALLQGLRRLRELAYVSVIGSAAGLLIAGPIYWWFGISGIVPALLLLSAVPVISAYYFSSRISLKKTSFSKVKFLHKAKPMVTLGVSTMLSGLVLILAMWLIRILVQRKFGLEALGQFQAGWGVTTIYLQLIFQAMGRDYYPKLSGMAGDHLAMNKQVNEQIHLSLLLGTPLLLFAIVAAPWIIKLLYSNGFNGAISQLQWLAFGTIFKLISWPLGFILLALRKSTAYFITESSAAGFLTLLVSWFIDFVGMDGIGLAYAIHYVFYFLLVWILARKFVVFRFDGRSKILLLTSILGCGLIFYIVYCLNELSMFLISVCISVGISIIYFIKLNQLTGIFSLLWKRIR